MTLYDVRIVTADVARLVGFYRGVTTLEVTQRDAD